MTRTALTPLKNLECGIDCDGGLMSVVRVKDEKAITFTLDPNRHLRLTARCNSSGRSLTLSGHDTGIVLKLVAAEAAACRPLERWRKRPSRLLLLEASP